MARAADFKFIGGSRAGIHPGRLLADGSAPNDSRVLLSGLPSRAPRQYDDGQRREWDVYLRDGTDESRRPLYRHQGQEITGVS